MHHMLETASVHIGTSLFVLLKFHARIFEPKREGVILFNEKLHNFYYLPNINRIINSRGM
jgi:hypothetical protein